MTVTVAVVEAREEGGSGTYIFLYDRERAKGVSIAPGGKRVMAFSLYLYHCSSQNISQTYRLTNRQFESASASLRAFPSPLLTFIPVSPYAFPASWSRAERPHHTTYLPTYLPTHLSLLM